MSQNHSSSENIIFDKLCMEGNLEKIDDFAKIHQDKLDYVGDKSFGTGIVYRLAKANKINVLHYFFNTPYISSIPNIYTGPENGQKDDALEILYNNKQIDFIKYLLIGDDIKDNLDLSYTYLTDNNSQKLCAKVCSPLFELCLQNNDWTFADYLINSPEIKNPVERHFSLIVETIFNLRNKVNMDDEFISKFVLITQDYLNKQFETLKNLSDPDETHPIPDKIKVKIIHELIKQKFINVEQVLDEIEENSKDEKWVVENYSAINLSKVLLQYKINAELPTSENQPKKHKM